MNTVSSVNQASTLATIHSDQYRALTIQIESKQDAVKHYQELDRITKAQTVADQIPALLAQRANLKPDNVLAANGKLIIVIVAAAIELVSFSMAISLSQYGVRQVDTDKIISEPSAPVAKTVTIEAKTKIEDEILQAIKVGAFEKITVSAIASVYKINRNKISNLLNEMTDLSILEWVGSRRVLAA